MLRTFSYEFYMLILVTRGRCVQFIDFTSTCCTEGDLVILQPGQAHRFGTDKDWDGWMILFRPEFVMEAPDTGHQIQKSVPPSGLPEKMTLSESDFQRLNTLIMQMRADAAMTAGREDIQDLLRYQILLLLKFVSIHYARALPEKGCSDATRRRFRQFSAMVEKQYAHWHQLADYSKALGCSEKSLSRATLEAAGMPAKAFIAARIVLEAKRMLAHTGLPVGTIAQTLGFEETTHFSKFFKRVADLTPGEFRLKQTES